MNQMHPDDRCLEQTRVRWRWAFYIALVIAVSFLIETWIGAEVALHPTLLPGFDVPRMGSQINAKGATLTGKLIIPHEATADDDDCCMLSNRRASR